MSNEIVQANVNTAVIKDQDDFFNAISSPYSISEEMAANKGEVTINCHGVISAGNQELASKNTGEIQKLPVTIFIDENGEGHRTVSPVLANMVKLLEAVYGEASSWRGIKLLFKKEQKSGRFINTMRVIK